MTAGRSWLRPRHAVPVAVAVLAAATVVVLTASRDGGPPRSSAPPIRHVPPAITADCSRDVAAELNAFFGSVPDGSVVQFPPGGCYTQSDSVLLKARAGLTIDGGGSTFRSTAPNDNTKLVPNWWLMRVRNVTLRNLTAIGNFDDPGPPSPQRGSVTSNAGVAIYGGIDVFVRDVTIRNVFGDGVTLGNSAYFDNTAPAEFARNVHLERLNVSKAARHCISPSQVTGFWLEDSILDDCYLDGLDAEKDLLTDPLSDLHILRNTFTNYFAVGVVIPVGGSADNPVDGIEIRGNRFPTLPSAAVCNQAIAVGGYPGQFFSNVVIEGNEMLTWRVGIEVVRSLSGSIRDNVVRHPPEAKPNDCGPEHEADVVVSESPDVRLASR